MGPDRAGMWAARQSWIVLACALVALSMALIARRAYRPTSVDREESGRIALIVSGDTNGWLVPCGCASNQSGGLPRRATYVGRARQERAVILADAGGAPGGLSPYDRAKFEAILAGESAMGIAAHNLGGPEASLGAGTLRDLQRRTGAPFVSANLRDATGTLVSNPFRLITTDAMRVALVGVLSPRFASAGMRIDDPRDAVVRTVQNAPKHDALVVLAYMPEAELRQLASELPEADIIVGGPTGQSVAPIKIGPTWLASATNKGKFLVQFEAHRTGRGRSWTGRVVEMGPELADETGQRHILTQFRAELARLDLPAEQTGQAVPLPPNIPEGYRVAGTESCRSCHQRDCQVWDASNHARAWLTLQSHGDHVDPQCQRCHTTGYGLPGGFRSTLSSPDRTAVGCESCHGPSLAHIRVTSTKTSFAAKDQCVACHDMENSPRFRFDEYWERIRHGATRSASRTIGHLNSTPTEAQP